MRMMFAEPPLEALLADAADGRFSAGAVASALAFACFAVFTTSKIFALRRLAGGGRFALKVSSAVAIACALLATTLFSLLAQRLDFSVEWAGVSRASSFSARTREILSGTSQEVLVTACLRRNAPEFLAVSRLLRAFEAESRNLASAGVRCAFVDPRWDPNAAARVVRRGGGEGMLVFSAGRRRIVVPAKEVDESVCASAIQRLSMPAKHEAVMFTAGHGEPSVSDIGPLGLSDAAQVLKQEGYHISTLFSATSPIPSDCAVLAVIGPRTPFSEVERRDIGKFLLQGGRLLATVSSVAGSGLEGLLETYGLSVEAVRGNQRTTDGADIVVSDFGDHAVSGPLTGSVVVFAPDAVRFKSPPPASAPEGGFSFTALCGAEASAYALAGERGTALKSDLAIHPARLVVIGDSAFLGNAALASRANANRDFFLNAVAWLAGLDVSGSPGMGGNVISARMDRRLRIRFVLLSVVLFPVAAAYDLYLSCYRIDLLISVNNVEAYLAEVLVVVHELLCIQSHVHDSGILERSLSFSAEGEVGFSVQRIAYSCVIPFYSVLLSVVVRGIVVARYGYDYFIRRSDGLVSVRDIERYSTEVGIVVCELSGAEPHLCGADRFS